jgi:hypothetical protein
MSNDIAATLPALESFGESVRLSDTTHSLADTVLEKVQDGSYDWPFVVGLFDDCLLELAGDFLFPDLEETADVPTDPGVGYIRMPANFHRELRYCHSISHNRKIAIKGSVIQLYRDYSKLDQSGVVRGVALKGRNLYYQRIPASAETLRLNFYRYPDRLLSRYDKPTIMPYNLARKLLVHYACREIYDEIEDGIEGVQKINTKYHDSRYQRAKAQLDMFLGPEEREPQEFPNEIDWDSMI